MDKKIIFTIIVSIIIGLIFYSNYLTDEQIIGTYINNENHSDTIEILPNNKYISNRFGKGIYKLKFKRLDLKIEFVDDSIGKLNTYVDRTMYFGKPKIHIDDDLEEYYEKIK